MNSQIRTLEHAAIRAHAAGQRWLDFWAEHRDQFDATPAGHERQAVIERVLHLLMTGDRGGMEPAGDGWPRPCDWEHDDAAPAYPVTSDVVTAARLDWAGIGAEAAR